MNLQSLVGWGLAVAAVTAGYASYGWPGVALAVTVVVFWLLLQFTRVMRAMRQAGQAPVGRVPSAVMLNARLNRGMRLLDIIALTHSLGERVADDPETYAWHDDSGATVQVQLANGRCSQWVLTRRDTEAEAAHAP
jgi:hypothetical protein